MLNQPVNQLQPAPPSFAAHQYGPPAVGNAEVAGEAAVGHFSDGAELPFAPVRARIDGIDGDVAAVAVELDLPAVDAAGVAAERRAVVLRAAEVAIAAGKDRAVVELRGAEIVIE